MSPNLHFDHPALLNGDNVHHHPRHVRHDTESSTESTRAWDTKRRHTTGSGSGSASTNTDDEERDGPSLWKELLLQSKKNENRSGVVEQDDPIRDALSSIRILQDASDHRDWLERYRGELHQLPPELLESIAVHAPQRLAARVADFNENLFYEMQPQAHRSDHPLGVLMQDLVQTLSSVVPVKDYLGSYLATETTVPQPAHVDYTWEVLEETADSLRLGFLPLTEEGMFLQVWPPADNTSVREIPGELIYIPYGRILVLPASTIHGGGFRTTHRHHPQDQRGNLRFHLYMARGRGGHSDGSGSSPSLPKHQTNKYTEPHDQRRELCERYIDAPHMETLHQNLFV